MRSAGLEEAQAGITEAEHGYQGTPASTAALRRLRHCGSQALEHAFYNFGTQAELLHGMWFPLEIGRAHV